MKSGIYVLKFDSGYTYIGKSVDINARYKQHLNSLRRGNHTAELQAHYKVWGIPRCEVLELCHPDHLDVLERSWISRGVNLLNSLYPDVPEHDLWIRRYSGVLENSTGSVVKYMSETQTELKNLRDEGVVLPGELDRLRDLELEVASLRAYKSRSWWYKLWN
jgi:hypothetical protein